VEKGLAWPVIPEVVGGTWRDIILKKGTRDEFLELLRAV